MWTFVLGAITFGPYVTMLETMHVSLSPTHYGWVFVAHIIRFGEDNFANGWCNAVQSFVAADDEVRSNNTVAV